MHDAPRPAAEDLPPLPRPWRPAGSAPRIGCARPFLAGCGCLAFVLVGLLAVAQWQSAAIMDWTVGWWQSTLVELTEDNLNDAQRNRVQGAFDGLRRALENGSVDWSTATEINRIWTSMLRQSGGAALTWPQILPLIERLERLETAPSDGGPAPARDNGEVLA